MLSMELGRHHPLLKRLRQLRRSPALRREEGRMLAEGLHLAEEALQAEAEIETVIFDPRLEATDEGQTLLKAFHRSGVPLGRVAASVMQGLQDAQSAQPILCLIDSAPLDAPPFRPQGAVVLLDGIQDPGNLGGILRSADAAGVAGVIICGASCDRFHPRTVRASMGASFRLPTRVDTLEQAVARLREEGHTICATDSQATQHYTSICEIEKPAILFGSEGAGLDEATLDKADVRLKIPMHGRVESLSVGAAAAVLLFELGRSVSPSDPAPADE
jgi:TrmH family RNA methyltransferase